MKTHKETVKTVVLALLVAVAVGLIMACATTPASERRIEYVE